MTANGTSLMPVLFAGIVFSRWGCSLFGSSKSRSPAFWYQLEVFCLSDLS
ncbi:hypothetical protein [Halosegnis longus]|nr:hypothetical protein [Salella cibi]